MSDAGDGSGAGETTDQEAGPPDSRVGIPPDVAGRQVAAALLFSLGSGEADIRTCVLRANQGEDGLAISVTKLDDGRLRLSLEGELARVSKATKALHEDEAFKEESPFLEVDEAGAFLREQAYPFLASIEQGLRVFINEAMTRVHGGDWWPTQAPVKAQERATEISGKHQRRSHKLDCLFFGDLVDWITEEYQLVPDGSSLTWGDLAELVDGAQSITDLGNAVSAKLAKRSPMQEVFSKFLPEDTDWERLSSLLKGKILDLRNAVMHHSPFFLDNYVEVTKAAADVGELLAKVEYDLSEAEKVDAQRVLEERQEEKRYRGSVSPDWHRMGRIAVLNDLGLHSAAEQAMHNMLNKTIDPSVKMQRGVEKMLNKTIDPSVKMQRGVEKMLNKTIDPSVKMQRGVEKMLNKTIDPSVKMQRGVEKLLLNQSLDPTRRMQRGVEKLLLNQSLDPTRRMQRGVEKLLLNQSLDPTRRMGGSKPPDFETDEVQDSSETAEDQPDRTGDADQPLLADPDSSDEGATD